MRKTLHDGLSCRRMNNTDVDYWSNKKYITHPTRSKINTETFTTTGNPCLNIALLETERCFFGNTTEKTFTESSEDCDVSSYDRKKVLLLMEKRTCFSGSVFRSVRNWTNAREKLKKFHANYFVQCEAHKRGLIISSE